MSQGQNKIRCPKCGEEINVNDILYHQVDEQLKKQYNDELAKEKEKYEVESSKLDKERKQLEANKKKQEEEIDNQVKEKINQREIVLKKKYKAEAEEEQSDAISSLREELEEKSGKIKELNKITIELEKLKREKMNLRNQSRQNQKKN